MTPATLIPICGAIFVFGVVYGAAAQPLFGALLTVVSSVLVFSGTAQFTMVGLVVAAASPISVLWAVFVVNVRNFALGGALRPHLHGALSRRLGISWFLIDETVGLALVDPENADRVVLVSGAFAYASWV
ncbi:MAG TPA: AzlC family ABC transporter permease, partial [Acidimicrobiia bacterium]